LVDFAAALAGVAAAFVSGADVALGLAAARPVDADLEEAVGDSSAEGARAMEVT
jgi:hypothetical protein